MDHSALTDAMKGYFDQRKDLIEHTLQVTAYAEQLLSRMSSTDIDPDVVLAAALMHDIGIVEAERKHGSGAGHYQEIEGPPIVRGIMESLKLSDDLIEEVCSIVAHHHSPGRIQTTNFAILYDADWLVNLPNQYQRTGSTKVPKAAIESRYLTAEGKRLAAELFLQS